jgi:hypothetical protein
VKRERDRSRGEIMTEIDTAGEDNNGTVTEKVPGGGK